MKELKITSMNEYKDITSLTSFEAEDVVEAKIVRITGFLREVIKNPPETWLDIFTLREDLGPAIVCLFTSIFTFILMVLSIKKWRIMPTLFMLSLVHIALTILETFRLPSGASDLAEMFVAFLIGATTIVHYSLNAKMSLCRFIILMAMNNAYQMVYSVIDLPIILVLPLIVISIQKFISSPSKYSKVLALYGLVIQLLLICKFNNVNLVYHIAQVPLIVLCWCSLIGEDENKQKDD